MGQAVLFQQHVQYVAVVAIEGDVHPNGAQRARVESWYGWPGEESIRERVRRQRAHICVLEVGELRERPHSEWRPPGVSLLRGFMRRSLLEVVKLC